MTNTQRLRARLLSAAEQLEHAANWMTRWSAQRTEVAAECLVEAKMIRNDVAELLPTEEQ